jgi:hypothetical protein
MRDYTNSATSLYRWWQQQQHPDNPPRDPPLFSMQPSCEPLLDDNRWQWLGFREELLASRYNELCRLVHGAAKKGENGNVKCLLHFGKMFATTDILHSNIFFELAKSPWVDHLVMDSNMALSGAPSSPSIVGILVSAAQHFYGKTVHYEAATERILPCNDEGKPLGTGWDRGGQLLLKTGIQNALEAGVHSIGITNLCLPEMATRLFGELEEPPQNAVSSLISSPILHTASHFHPTAIL